jgi:hypothetical protein
MSDTQPPAPILGIDTASSTINHIHDLWGLGYRFVIRYCSPDTPNHPEKCITPQEAQDLRSDLDGKGNGMAIGLVWETEASIEALTGTGQSHAEQACRVAAGIGYGPGCVIDWACDFEELDSQDPVVLQYATDFRSTVLAQGWRAGCYGEGSLLGYLLEAGVIEQTWLTESTGYPGYEDWVAKCDILQRVQTDPIAGLEVDVNEIRPEVGLKGAGLWC